MEIFLEAYMTSYARHFPDVEIALAVPCISYLHFEAAEHGRRQSEPPDDEGLALVGELPVGGRGQLAQPQEGAPLTLLLRPQVHVLHEIQGFHIRNLKSILSNYQIIFAGFLLPCSMDAQSA